MVLLKARDEGNYQELKDAVADATIDELILCVRLEDSRKRSIDLCQRGIIQAAGLYLAQGQSLVREQLDGHACLWSPLGKLASLCCRDSAGITRELLEIPLSPCPTSLPLAVLQFTNLTIFPLYCESYRVQ